MLDPRPAPCCSEPCDCQGIALELSHMAGGSEWEVQTAAPAADSDAEGWGV